MKKRFVIWSELNQIGFGVEVDEKDYEWAKDLSLTGWNQWNDPEKYPEYESMGYAEPSMKLMDMAGIKYRMLDEKEMEEEEHSEDHEVITDILENTDKPLRTARSFEPLLQGAASLPDDGKTQILPAAVVQYNDRIYKLHFQVEKGYFKQVKKTPRPEFCVRVWVESPSFPNIPMFRLDTASGFWPCEADIDKLHKTLETALKRLKDARIMHGIESTFLIKEIEHRPPANDKVSVLSSAVADLPAYKLHRKIYEMYQLDWMITHGHSLSELMKSMEEYRREMDPEEGFASVIELAANWDHESGFDGSLWVCEEEFLDAEYLDKEYINSLIPVTEKELRRQWEKDTGMRLPASVQEKKTTKKQSR